jgi:isopenicillin N synthase-like dioxygenase
MKIGTIWESDYVCNLGIKDHCDELLAIDNEIKKDKSLRAMNLKEGERCGMDEVVETLQSHFDAECMDLLLILAAKFDLDDFKFNNGDSDHLFQTRMFKFKEKDRTNRREKNNEL